VFFLWIRMGVVGCLGRSGYRSLQGWVKWGFGRFCRIDMLVHRGQGSYDFLWWKGLFVFPLV